MDHRPECALLDFGLIVTGEGEEEFLPLLFHSLRNSGPFRFRVIRRIGQRRPIIAPGRILRMTGRGQVIPTKDEEEIGLPARRFIQQNSCGCVIVVDDLEYEWRNRAQEFFNRYRLALDTIIRSAEDRRKVSVHLLVMMLEAYFFADATAINHTLGLQPSLQDYPGDVETIPHPKNKIKHLYPGYDEIKDGQRIIAQLNLEHVLAKPNTCAALRTLFAWCVEAILEYCPGFQGQTPDYQIENGIQYPITNPQLTILRKCSTPGSSPNSPPSPAPPSSSCATRSA